MPIYMASCNAIGFLRNRLFFVGLKVKFDKEAEIAGKQGTTKQCSSLIPCTVARMRKILIISADKMLVC